MVYKYFDKKASARRAQSEIVRLETITTRATQNK